MYQVHGMLKEGKGLEPKEVHLYQTTFLNLEHSVLAGQSSRLLVWNTERYISVQGLPADYDTCSVKGSMAVKSFQSYGCVEKLFVDSASVPYVLKLLLEFQGIRKMPLLHAWNFIRNQGCNLV